MSDAENQRSSVPQIEAVVIDKCSTGLIDKIRVPITQSRLGKLRQMDPFAEMFLIGPCFHLI